MRPSPWATTRLVVGVFSIGSLFWISLPLRAQVVRTGYTSILASNSAKCLDLAGESTTAGTGAVQLACNSGASQQWTVQNYNGSFRIVQQQTGGCLVVTNNSAGTQLVQEPCSGTTGEFWSFAPSGGSFQLVSKLSGLCASVSGASVSDAASIIQQACSTASNFIWTFSSGLITSTSINVLQAAHSGQCLEVSGASTSTGAAIDQDPCTTTTSQQWSLVPSAGYFQLVAKNSVLCLSNAGSTTSGAAIVQSGCSSSTSSGDLWTLTPTGGSYEVVAANGGLCLTVPGATLTPATALVQSACSAAQNQLWALSAASLPSSWTAVTQLPVDPIAVADLPNGDLIMWSANNQYNYQGDIGYTPGQTYTALFSPSTMTASSILVTNTGDDMFCPGTANLFNGSILVNGGDSSPKTVLYNPSSGVWSSDANMNVARGYEGDTVLTNGSVFTLGGSWSGGVGGKTAEVWTQGLGWTLLPGIPETPIVGPDPAGLYRGDNHLWLFSAPNGLVFHAGPSAAMHWIDPTGTGSIASAGNRGDDNFSINGNAVLYDVGKIMKAGGAPGYDSSNAEANAYVIDINGGVNGVQVTKLAPMAYPRAFSNGVVLPNGQVVIIGGQTFAQPFSDATAVLAPEIWDPRTGVFRQLNPMQTARVYHSSGILLSDGRVFSGGGGQCGPGCSANHFDTEILTPPYLLNADGSAAVRPSITSASSTVTLGGTLTANTDSPVASFVLMRLSSVTHTTNNDQRRVPLQMQFANGTSYILTVPSNPGILLPGNYWLFALNAQGVPSVAANVLVSPPSTQGFSIGASRSTLLAMQGGSTTDTITEVPQNGFSGSVTLSASGLPAGVTASFSANPTTGTSILTLTASASAVPGNYAITIRGISGSVTASTPISLVIGTANCTPTTITPNLQVTPNGWQQASSVTVVPGSIVNLGPQPAGYWFWTGPGGFYSSQQQVDGIPLSSGSNTFTGTLVNSSYCVSTQNFMITVGSSTGSFTLASSAANVSILQGSTGSETIAITQPSGTSDYVTMTASGLPAGVTASFSTNPSITESIVTLNVGAAAAAGTSTITITGTSGTVSAATSFSLTVGTGRGFTLGRSAAVLPLNQGSSATDTITVTPVGGFTGSVTLSASGLPAGVTAAFGSNPTTGSSVLTLTAAASVAPGAYNFTVAGISSTITASTQITLIIGNANCTPGSITPYLQINGGAWEQTATATVAQGTVVNFGPQPVGTWYWSGPAGFNSNQREIDGMTFTAGDNIFTGIYVDGNSCLATQIMDITLASGSSFALSASATTVSVTQGGSVTDTISIGGGFSGSVTLSASGLPAGVTASFSTNPTTSSSVLTLNVASTTTPLTYYVTVNGVSGSLSASTQITLVIGSANCTPTTLIPYLQVGTGAWQQTSTVSVPTGSTVNLGPQPSGDWSGTWSWSGPGGFGSNQRGIYSIPLSSGSNTYVVTYDNSTSCISTQNFVITVGSGASFTLSPSAPTVNLSAGSTASDTITVTPAGGFNGSVTLSASGLPSGVTASFGTNPTTSSSALTFAASASAAAGTYPVNVNGVSGSLSASTAVSLVVGSSSCTPTALIPYLQINTNPWQQVATASVASTDTVNLGPQPSGDWNGTWSWTGPGGFTSNQRGVFGIPLSAGSNTFVVTYVNSTVCTSTQNFVITVGGPGFTLSSSAPSVNLPQSGTATDTITVTPSGGFTGSVTLSTSGLPSGVTASFGTNPTTNSSVLTFSASASAVAGTYNVTISGVSGSLGASTHLSLVVGSAGCTPTTLIPYLQIGTNAWQQVSTATVPSGSTVNLGPQPSGDWNGTWSWTGPGGFTSNQRGVFGIPLSAGSNTFVVTYVNSTSCTSTQNFVITVSGSGFTLSSSAPTVNVARGGTATDTISVTPSGGFTGSVTLSASGLPSGVTASFGTNPTTTSSVLTFSASASAAAGTYNITVNGVSGSLTASTQISLVLSTGSTCTPTALIPYLQVNTSPWQQISTISVAATDTVNLGPQPSGDWGGTWSWSGPGGFTSNQRGVFGIPLSSGSNTFIVTYVNSTSCTSTQNFVITVGGAGFTLSSSAPTVNLPQGGAASDTITVTPSGGFNGSVTLSMSGLPSGVTASFGTNPTTSSSVLTFSASASAAAGTYNITISGVSGTLGASTQISLVVGSTGCTPTTLIPYLQIGTNPWQQTSTATVPAGSTVNLGPQPSGDWNGTWSWTGPGGFTSNQRGVFGIPLSSGSNNFVVTYVNSTSCTSTQNFVITE